MKHIFLLGSNGIPASYGGFETFVDCLVKNKKNEDIKYHVSCISNDKEKEFEYNGAHCFNICVPDIGPARAIYYDIMSMKYCCKYIKDNNIKDAIVYMLGCGIGPFIGRYIKRLHCMKAKFFINPDGLEWKRDKWSPMVRKYLKISEKYMVKYADTVICDSRNIEEYVQEEYKETNPNTTFIAYGADDSESILTNENDKVKEWYREKGVKIGDYYLIVGRFVQENNYEIMFAEFMKSKTDKDLVVITNLEHNKFYDELKRKTHFDSDKRIKLVGTVYDQDLLKFIRGNAFAYIHGHEVGGTNPSLLEALASTSLNLLLNVGFNREVGESGALYWDKKPGSLSNLIDNTDLMLHSEIVEYKEKSRKRITDYYNWENIVNEYEEIFLEG